MISFEDLILIFCIWIPNLTIEVIMKNIYILNNNLLLAIGVWPRKSWLSYTGALSWFTLLCLHPLFNMIIVNALTWPYGSVLLSNNTNGCFVLCYWRGGEGHGHGGICWIGWQHCGLQPRGYVEGLPIFGGGNGFVCGTTVVGMTTIAIPWCMLACFWVIRHLKALTF